MTWGSRWCSLAAIHFVWSHNLVYGNTTNFDGVADLTGKSGNISVDPEPKVG